MGVLVTTTYAGLLPELSAHSAVASYAAPAYAAPAYAAPAYAAPAYAAPAIYKAPIAAPALVKAAAPAIDYYVSKTVVI